jgi:hypothetical protein
VAYHAPLAQLVTLQRSLTTELVRQAQRAGAVDAGVDATRAAALLIASLQGLMLQWQLSGRALSLEEEAVSMLAFWRAGLAAGQPTNSKRAELDETGDDAQAQGDSRALVCLDVRPLFEAGREPLAEVLATLRRLPDDGILKLITPFRPAPLLSLLAADEYRSECREFEPGCWTTEVLAPDAAPPEDLLDLEAPGPLERILIATAELAPGANYSARTPRHPRMLLPRLEERGLGFEVHDELDGSALVYIKRPA